MPTYDFVCDTCHKQFSKILPMGKAVAQCEECKVSARKILSSPAIHFSGSGFYASDNTSGKQETKAVPSSSPSTSKEEKIPQKSAPDTKITPSS